MQNAYPPLLMKPISFFPLVAKANIKEIVKIDKECQLK